VKDKELTEKVIGRAYKVHNTLGSGFLEKVYENALCIELAGQGLQVRQQEPVRVLYDGHVVGDHVVDLLVEDRLIVEIKAVRQLIQQHEIQLVNYLVATQLDVGLLINFGPSVQIKRKHRQYRPQAKQS
jgi:GxxExxY protein